MPVETFWLALIASTLSSLGGLIGGFLLLANEQLAKRLPHVLMSFAAGVLLSVTFFDLLPEATAAFPDPSDALRWVLFGVIGFFAIERLVATFHSDEQRSDETLEEVGLSRAKPLVILGDTVHNLIDGVVVAIAFSVDAGLGIATAISVLLHEIPHEIADFAILLRGGMVRRRVMLVNVFSALVAPIGTVLAFAFTTAIESAQPYLLAVAAGNLLYVGLADLLPHLHHERRTRRVVMQLALFLAAVLLYQFMIPGHAES